MEIHHEHLQKYKFVRSIGEGSFARVWLAIHIPLSQEVAIKIIKKDKMSKEELSELRGQIEILKSLQHPLIVGYYEMVETEHTIYLVMEYCPHESLKNYLDDAVVVAEEDAKRLFIQIISVLHYLHEQKQVAHRDIKPENMVIDAFGNIRLIDFNLSCKCDQILYDRCGSLAYMAPEILLNKGYTEMVDIWSLGVMMYRIVLGTLPFDDVTENRIIQKILYMDPRYTDAISEDLYDLLNKMMEKDPCKRITIREIEQHHWFTSAQMKLPENLDDFMKSLPESVPVSYNPENNNQMGKENDDVVLRIAQRNLCTEKISLQIGRYQSAPSFKNMIVGSPLRNSPHVFVPSKTNHFEKKKVVIFRKYSLRK